MIRMSDILKRRIYSPGDSLEPKPKAEKEPVEEKPKAEKKPVEEKPPALPTPKKTSSIQFTKMMAKEDSQKQKPQDMQIVKAVKGLQRDVGCARALYSKGIQLVKKTLESVTGKRPIEVQPIKDLVGEFVSRLVLGDKALFALFYENYPPKDYLCNHMINVMIISVEVGLGLGYNKSQLDELALAAFLHDIGMTAVKDITSQPRSLTEEEYNRIKKHPVYGAEVISQLKDLPQEIVYAIQEHHERVNGTGYSKGIDGRKITEYALIIGTVDVYEALTHRRVYREKHLPHEAIKNIFSSGSSSFDARILKVLISRVGIYPVSSYVELNTKEIGKVIAVNDEFPLRPVVNLIFDSTKNRLKDPRVVDLSKQVNLFVKKPLSDEGILRLTEKRE